MPHAFGVLLAGQKASGQSFAMAQYPASNGSHAHVPSFVKRVPVAHATAHVFSVSHASPAMLAPSAHASASATARARGLAPLSVN